MIAANTSYVLDKARAGERLNEEEALMLFERANIVALGAAADAVRFRLHPEKIVTYIVDRNVNYTNICVTFCKFCAFDRPLGHKESYTLTREQLHQKIDELVMAGGVQILLQGGHHPHYKIEWYEDLLRFIKTRFPKIHIHGFSPPEIDHFAKLNKMPLQEVIRRLKEAGLDTIPGGGAEILVDRVRKKISPLKCTAEEWLAVMRTAHELGLRTTATMMYGHVETYAERVEHLRRVRDLQDATGGFTAFICWSFQREHTDMEHLPETNGHEYLKTLAVSRLYLDNVPNMQSSWVTQGDKIGQMALRYGANDMGSTMLEENVVSAAGADFRLTEAEIRCLIEDLNYTPKRRNCYYQILD